MINTRQFIKPRYRIHNRSSIGAIKPGNKLGPAASIKPITLTHRKATIFFTIPGGNPDEKAIKAGHLVHYEVPENVNPVLVEFLLEE